MSARASAYAKTLVVCPNGGRLTRGEKLVLIVLADNHQDKAKHFTYPSVETIAEDALCDRRTCQRYLASLERKGVIRRLRPANQGSGMMVFYFFTALDAIPEGWRNAALFQPQLFGQKGGGRAAEGRQKGGKTRTASTNTNLELELKATTPLPPQAGVERDGGAEAGEAAPEFDSEQRRHLDGLLAAGHADRAAVWEHSYRDENRKAAEAAARARADAKREDALKRILTNEQSATEWVMNECGFHDDGRKRGLQAVIRGVLTDRNKRGSPVWVTGPAMAQAWRDYDAIADLLAVQYGPVNFFKLAVWERRNSWRIDERKRELAKASAGSGR